MVIMGGLQHLIGPAYTFRGGASNGMGTLLGACKCFWGVCAMI
jgi:hypothetical protein